MIEKGITNQQRRKQRNTMKKSDDIKDEMDRRLPGSQTDQAFPTLELDPEDYCEQMEDMDLTEEQAQEFLQTLWNIMSMMVDIGWGLDTVQLFLPADAENAVPDSGNRIK